MEVFDELTAHQYVAACRGERNMYHGVSLVRLFSSVRDAMLMCAGSVQLVQPERARVYAAAARVLQEALDQETANRRA